MSGALPVGRAEPGRRARVAARRCRADGVGFVAPRHAAGAGAGAARPKSPGRGPNGGDVAAGRRGTAARPGTAGPPGLAAAAGRARPTSDELLPPHRPRPGAGLIARRLGAGRRRADGAGRRSSTSRSSSGATCCTPTCPAAAATSAIAGGPQSGKSTMMRTLICALALTHTPREVQFYCLDFGGGALALAGSAAARRRGGGTAGHGTGGPQRSPRSPPCWRQRERLFADHGVDSMATYRRRRARRGSHRRRPVRRRLPGHRRLVHAAPGVREPGVRNSATSSPAASTTASTWWSARPGGRRSGRGCVTCSAPGSSCASVTRWTPRSTSGRPRRCRAVPGRGLTAEKFHYLAGAAPHRRDGATPEDLATGTRAWWTRSRRAWTGRGPRPCACCRPSCRVASCRRRR